MKHFIRFLNDLPIKYWVFIYFIFLLGHILIMYLGHPLSLLGFAVALIPYCAILSKTRLWSNRTFFKSSVMAVTIIVIWIFKLSSGVLRFHEFYFLLGVYLCILLIMFYSLPIRERKTIDHNSVLFIRNLFCIILFFASFYCIYVGISSVNTTINFHDFFGLIYSFYGVAILITACCILYANTIVEDKEVTVIDEISVNDKLDVNSINQFFAESNLYLNHNFTIGDLSASTGIEKRRLSYVMNSCMQTNYYNLIAQHRIKKAQQILEKHSDYTLDYIATQCGFTSMPVFIKYFKIFVGTTPKKYNESFKKK